ncbi:MAG: hypothetical protein ABIT10_02485 [Alteraurantiacibacter sp.]
MAWSFMPANLEGCLVMGLFAVAMLGVFGGGLLLSRALDSIAVEIGTWVLAGATFVAFLRFSKRHS